MIVITEDYHLPGDRGSIFGPVRYSVMSPLFRYNGYDKRYPMATVSHIGVI